MSPDLRGQHLAQVGPPDRHTRPFPRPPLEPHRHPPSGHQLVGRPHPRSSQLRPPGHHRTHRTMRTMTSHSSHHGIQNIHEALDIEAVRKALDACANGSAHERWQALEFLSTHVDALIETLEECIDQHQDNPTTGGNR